VGRPYLLLAALAACGPSAAHGPRHPATTAGAATAVRCYDLPGAERYSLRLGPDGAAWWIERTVVYDYDGNSSAAERLVRMDPTTGAAATIATGVSAPFRLLGGGRIIYRHPSDDASSVVLWLPGGGTRTLTPPDLDVSHFEITPDQRTVVFEARGRGRTGAYAISLAGGAPVWLADADEVFTANADGAILSHDGAVVEVPLGGGKARALASFRATRPYDVVGGDVIHYDETHFYARPVAGGPDVVVLGPPGGWRMTGAPDHVFLSRRTGDRAEGARIEGRTARATPVLVGGQELDGASPLPGGGFVALVAQDTDNDGTPEDERDEVDVCRLPAAGEVRIPVRHVPRRIAGAEARLAALARGAGATWSVVEDPPGPMTVNLTFTGDGGNDLAALRARVRTLAQAIVETLGDPELRVVLAFADGRRAASYTDDLLHRRISVAGVGRAVASEPSEYDLEVVKSSVARGERGEVTCNGEVRNRSGRSLAGVVADCIAGRTDAPVAIVPDPLPPGALGIYAGTIADVPGADLGATYRAGTSDLLALDDQAEATRRALFDAAATAFDRSRLTLWSWQVDGGAVTAELEPPTGWGDFSTTAKEVAATAAFDALAHPLRLALGAAADAPVTLHIHLSGGQVMDYDGEALHAPRTP
jgi:hypothetical protein